MKKIIPIFLALAFSVSACSLLSPISKSSKPSEFDIQTAIAKTQEIEDRINAGISLTLTAAVTSAPLATETPIASETPISTSTEIPPTQTPTETQKPYFSPTPTLNLQLTLETINKCDYAVEVKVTGPMSWSITIPAHTKDSRQIVRGEYHFWNSKGDDFDYDLRVAHWLWTFCPNGYYN